METSYKPHSYSRSTALPSLPPGISLAPIGGQAGLKQWVWGLSSTPAPHYSPEAIEFCQKRWETKWSYYKKTQQEEHSLSTLGKQALFAHVQHLWLYEKTWGQASAEMACGVQFVLSLIESQTPALFRLKAAEMDSVKLIDQVYQFAIQSLDTITRLRMQQVLEMRAVIAFRLLITSSLLYIMEQTMDPDLESARSISVRSELEDHKGDSASDRREASIPSASIKESSGQDMSDPAPGPSRIVPNERTIPPNGVVMDEKGIIQRGPNYFSYPPNTNGTATVTRGSDRPPVPAPPVTQALSTVASHRYVVATLLSLSAISFFGAGMAWATVFSGTRGDLVLISWAASCFIVATATAACGTSLLDADGTLVERFMAVRWTVRVLSLCATIHVFVGIMLVSAAILILDPNMDSPAGGTNGHRFNVVAERVAGGCSLVICGIAVLLTFIVQRRYRRRTWFSI
ncbi:hypothetical protein AG1IA_06630 [Rhizoctonia solani AG-1 IA]|uniref:Uncharacterized protein n=1 Tax=Thanatephorus cucumeris (strain AG1-IA) TaxID=983506 RepID=L8WN15_THACA|nr:hypothetical protein AG1IA_06630 [Rhizoctonia solani AG-1 IA]